ncbi:hypothetical protein AAE478_009848 [Parahypoxylon ruwenzoriense]
MTSDVNIPRRPSLEPLWTNYRNLGGLPKTAFRSSTSPGLSASPVSPRSLPSPSPIHPATYDGSMRRQDRALINSLDQRARRGSIISSTPLTPIDEYSPSPLVSRLEKISILPPLSVPNGLPTPASPDFSPRQKEHHFWETSGSVAFHDGMPGHKHYTTDINGLLVPPVSPRTGSVIDLRDQLRTWGHVYYGNAKSADAFFIARSLRQHSHHSSTGTGQESRREMGAPLNQPQRASNRLTVRAIVRPRAIERPSFLIQRNFNIDELRATIPDPPRHSAYNGIQLNGSLHEPRSPARNRRSGSIRSSTLIRPGSSTLDFENLMRDAKAIPIHLKYAQAYLPVVAALLVSGHVREGDVIYLPMPHAEAWPQTALYVYTGQGELTEAVRENILYLAGKV